MKVILRNMAGNELNIEINDNNELMSDIRTQIRMEIVQPLYFNKFVEAFKDLFNDELDSINIIFGVEYKNSTSFYTDSRFWCMQRYVLDDIYIIDPGEPYEGRVYNYVLINPSDGSPGSIMWILSSMYLCMHQNSESV